VSAPAELNLAAVLRSIQFSLSTLLKVGPNPSPEIDRYARRVVDQMMSRRLRSDEKLIWCDKSLINAMNAPLLYRLWPKARFISLYRHCMDVVYSGLEACPWGASGYGFDSYAIASPGNTVGALVAYWIDHSRACLQAEATEPKRTFRLHYEELVTRPKEIVAQLCSFLDLPFEPEMIDFPTTQPPDGPGDYKTEFLNTFDSSSIGRGAAVPVSMLNTALRLAANSILEALGYAPITDEWNAWEASGSPILDRNTAIPFEPEPLLHEGPTEPERLHHGAATHRFVDIRLTSPGTDEAWIFDSDTCSLRQRKSSDIPTTQSKFIAPKHILYSILQNEGLLGPALRHGTVRYFDPTAGPTKPAAVTVRAILEAFRGELLETKERSVTTEAS